jgi:hypothetical protein
VSDSESPKPAASLGILISEHVARRELVILHAILAGVGLGGGIGAAAYGVWRCFFAFQHYGPAVVWRWSRLPLAFSLALICIGIFGLVKLIQLRGLTIRTYRRGLTYGKGKRRKVILWPQVRSIHTSAVLYDLPGLGGDGHAAIELRTDDERRLKLTSALGQLEQLARVVKRSVYPGLLDEYRQMLRRRESLSFGPLELSEAGIRHGKRVLRWVNVDRVVLNRGQLLVSPSVGETANRIRVSVNKIPNLEVCAHMIKQLGAAA